MFPSLRERLGLGDGQIFLVSFEYQKTSHPLIDYLINDCPNKEPPSSVCSYTNNATRISQGKTL